MNAASKLNTTANKIISIFGWFAEIITAIYIFVSTHSINFKTIRYWCLNLIRTLDVNNLLIASRDYDYMFKLQLIGDGKVGKSSIIQRYTEAEFETESKKDAIKVHHLRTPFLFD